MMAADPDAGLPRLLQLASPALPVGAFAFSEGLEQAVEAGWVRDAAGAGGWILGLLEHGPGRLDVPLFARLHAAWCDGDAARARVLSRWLLACRETAELRAADRLQGQALARVLAGLGETRAETWLHDAGASFAALFALAAARWRLGCDAAATALLWSWCENVTAAVVKLVPLGQRDGQRILFEAGTRIPQVLRTGLALDDDAIAGGMPGHAIASARHEVQRTRLFRS